MISLYVPTWLSSKSYLLAKSTVKDKNYPGENSALTGCRKKKKKKDKKVGLSESPLFLVCLISVYLATNFKYHLNRTCSVLCMQQPGKTAGSASSV